MNFSFLFASYFINQRVRKDVKTASQNFVRQRGNVLFIILIAIALVAALTLAIRGLNSSSGDIDKETLAIRASEVQRYMSELEQAVRQVLTNGYSENDIRFAHSGAHADYGNLFSDSDKGDQVFHARGGAASYRVPFRGINDSSSWEFYGHTALPGVGSDRADLVAVLPNVTAEFCNIVNQSVGYMSAPTDSGVCLKGSDSDRFDDGTQFSGSPNTVNSASFSIKPSVRGCITCGDSRHYFYVLLAR